MGDFFLESRLCKPLKQRYAMTARLRMTMHDFRMFGALNSHKGFLSRLMANWLGFLRSARSTSILLFEAFQSVQGKHSPYSTISTRPTRN